MAQIILQIRGATELDLPKNSVVLAAKTGSGQTVKLEIKRAFGIRPHLEFPKTASPDEARNHYTHCLNFLNIDYKKLSVILRVIKTLRRTVTFPNMMITCSRPSLLKAFSMNLLERILIACALGEPRTKVAYRFDVSSQTVHRHCAHSAQVELSLHPIPSKPRHLRAEQEADFMAMLHEKAIVLRSK